MPGIGSRSLSVAVAIMLQLASTLCASSQEQPYRGKQIRMVIGSGAGGGYDTYGRILSRFLEKYIPGKPSVVIQNMPGAAGMTAMNWAYNVAPKDGTVILATFNVLLAQPLFDDPTVQYDMQKFEPVGSFSKIQNTCITWHTSPIKTIQQAKEREVLLAATGAAGNSVLWPKIMNAVLGTKFKPVVGYGTSEQRLALERGEAEGICGLSWSTIKASTPDWVMNKRINVLVQTGGARQKALPDVPLVLDFVTNSDDRTLLNFMSFIEELGRPFIMPPGTPPALVSIVRRAFDASLSDPEMIREAEAQLLEVDPISGEDMARIIRGAYAIPKSVVKRVSQIAAE